MQKSCPFSGVFGFSVNTRFDSCRLVSHKAVTIHLPFNQSAFSTQWGARAFFSPDRLGLHSADDKKPWKDWVRERRRKGTRWRTERRRKVKERKHGGRKRGFNRPTELNLKVNKRNVYISGIAENKVYAIILPSIRAQCNFGWRNCHTVENLPVSRMAATER